MKTDNGHVEAKLMLRRYFLQKYHSETPPVVMDCFQGEGLLWSKLSSDFTLAQYWGVDVKPKSGRLRIASERILEQRGWNADVVDLDSYGSPWKHWRNLVRTFDGEAITVLLTVGIVLAGGGKGDRTIMKMAGLFGIRTRFPEALAASLSKHCLGFALAEAEQSGLRAVDVREAFPQSRCRYIGVRLERMQTAKP